MNNCADCYFFKRIEFVYGYCDDHAKIICSGSGAVIFSKPKVQSSYRCNNFADKKEMDKEVFFANE